MMNIEDSSVLSGGWRDREQRSPPREDPELSYGVVH